VSRLNAILASSAAACVLLSSATISRAEEVEKKFRLGISVGGFSTTDQIHSSSGNRRTLFTPEGEFDDRIVDPRNDSGAFSDFGIQSQYGGVVSATYALNRLWYIEASAGYRRGTVGNVQVQAQFDGVQVPIDQDFLFAIYNLDGGTITQVPIQFTGGVRFRPKAALNPFICAGVGYTINSFEPSSELNQLSLDLSQLTGSFAQLTGTQFQGERFEPSGATQALTGIKVDVKNEPEWHAGGGLEYSFKSHWVVFLDARYSVSSGRFGMTVNGSDELGISVPSDQVINTDPNAFGPFGAVQISNGGLVDGGSYTPNDATQQNPDAFCAANGNQGCHFEIGRQQLDPATGQPISVKDPGKYYIEAGKIRYDGFSVQIGVKFTF
jgi:opacity protein-like surface antigen